LEFGHIVDQQQFDVLLTHGTQLTSLSCGNVYLEEDRSLSACSLKSVTLTEAVDTVRFLANMPLHSPNRPQFVEEQGDDMNLPGQRPVLLLYGGKHPLAECLRNVR
jgi:hypothetical protein